MSYQNPLAFGVLALSIFATDLTAQEVLGRSMVNGRAVELLADGTWTYLDEADVEAGCDSLRDGVAFCGENFGWELLPAASPDITAQYRFDDQTYGIIIVEGVGSDQGIASDFMLEMVVELAAGRSGTVASNIPVLGVVSQTIDKTPVETITYVVNFSGTNFVFMNSIAVRNETTLQFVTYTFGTELTDEKRAIHAGFTDLIRISDE